MRTLGDHVRLTETPRTTAPDGSGFRRLVTGARAQLGYCDLAPGQVSQAVAHRKVEELWYVLAGAGELWRQAEDRQAVIDLEPGLAVVLPPRVRFQFRAAPEQPLHLLIVTTPPWPGDAEARAVRGHW